MLNVIYQHAVPFGGFGNSSPRQGADEVPGPEQSRAPRTLEQQMSLKPGDDERTEISKKISWILRHGAKKAQSLCESGLQKYSEVNVNIDETGWVNVNDLLSSDSRHASDGL